MPFWPPGETWAAIWMPSRGLAFRVRQDFGQVHGCNACPLAMESPTNVHQAGGISRTENLRTGIQHVAHLVTEHGQRSIDVLDGEGAPKAAALVGIRKFHQVDAPDRAQQL